MSILLHDVKFALRTLAKKPAFSLMVVGMLALGIAGNTAIFSVFDGLFLRPMPLMQPERLVDLDETAPRWNLKFVGIAYPDFHAWRQQNSAFQGMAVWDGSSFNLSGRGEARRIKGARVTHDLATVLGVKPLLGRGFLPAEDKPGAASVALLGFGLWQRNFGGDPNVLGRILELDGKPYTVIGVLPREAVFPSDAELWVPLAADPNEGNGWYLSGVGRLKPGVTIDQARADLARVHKNQIPTREVNGITSPVMMPLRDRYLGDYKMVTSVLLGAVAIVLLIACVNVAGLMMARGTGRAREVAIRTAIGASRRRIVRQLLTESLLLAAAGAALGVLLGSASLRAMLSLIPDELPRWVSFDLDVRFLLFCVLVTGAATVLFGLAPAMQASRVDVRGFLQDAAPRFSLTGGRRRSLSALVIGEIALALMLLISAGLLFQAFRKITKVDPGFRAENVLVYSLDLPEVKYGKPEQQVRFFQDLLERTRALPGVKSAGACTAPPLGGHWGNFFQVEGARPLGPKEQDPVILQRIATPGYFDAIGLTFLAGRPLTESDGEKDGARTVIVNQSFAKRYWPGSAANAIGKRIRHNGGENPWMEVVGVTRDVKHYGLDQEMRPGVYLPHRQNPVNFMTMVIRGSAIGGAANPLTLVAPARDLVRQIDANLPIFEIHTMTERLERSLWVRRAYSWLFGVFAAVAFALAAAGIYGVVSYAVSQRSHEIGIRMALGAQPSQVLREILSQGMALVSTGVVVGVAGALAASRLLETLLFGVSSRDPLTYLAVILALGGVALLANLLPARRAAAVDPMRALRFE